MMRRPLAPPALSGPRFNEFIQSQKVRVIDHEGENLGATSHPKIGIWKYRPENRELVLTGIDRLLAMADGGDLNEIQL